MRVERVPTENTEGTELGAVGFGGWGGGVGGIEADFANGTNEDPTKFLAGDLFGDFVKGDPIAAFGTFGLAVDVAEGDHGNCGLRIGDWGIC